VKYYPTDEMVADVMTNAVTKHKLVKFESFLCGW